MSRRRSRRRFTFPEINWTWTLWSLFVLNLIAGCLYSPITRANSIRVAGASAADENRIRGVLERVRGIPSAQVSTHAVVSAVLENPRIEGAEYTQNLFGRGALKLRQKSVVASLEGEPVRLMLADGTIVEALVGAPPGLPVIESPGGNFRPSLGVLGEWEREFVAQLAVEVRRSFPDSNWRIMTDGEGVISLQVVDGARVIMGNSDKVKEKLKKLEEMVMDDPEILQKVRRINLLSPENPMVVR